MRRIIIAIDGYSSCGKSTLARQLAQKLNYRYIDTGAMYRAVTLYLQQHGIDYSNPSAVKNALSNIQIDFQKTGGQNQVTLNGVNVEKEIRGLKVSSEVSQVAALSPVRRALVAQQQRMGETGGIVMDGRDIGTVVFPNADLKIFLTAEPEVRVHRRYEEMKAKKKRVSLEEVRENLRTRDRIDSTRADSPLTQAEDARILDNSHIGLEEQLEIAMQWAQSAIEASSPSYK